MTKETKKIYMIIILIILVFSISSIVILNISRKYKKYKIDTKKELVYTLNSKENEKIPFVNISSDKIDFINEHMQELYEDIIDYQVLDYKWNVNGNILSLLVYYVDNNNIDNLYKIHFETYIIDITTGERLSDEEILENYHINFDELENKIKDKFENMYQMNSTNNCDYECYLNNIDVESYLEKIYFYIENGNLLIYKQYYSENYEDLNQFVVAKY